MLTIKERDGLKTQKTSLFFICLDRWSVGREPTVFHCSGSGNLEPLAPPGRWTASELHLHSRSKTGEMSVVVFWWLPALHDDSATSLGPNQMTPLHDCIDFFTETYIHSAILCYTTDVINTRHCGVSCSGMQWRDFKLSTNGPIFFYL